MITFLYDVDNSLYWQDGLYAALRLLEMDFRIDYVNLSDEEEPLIPSDSTLVVWGGVYSRQVQYALNYASKKVLLYAGGPEDHPCVHQFNHVCVEDEYTMHQMRKIGVNATIAFGTNTKIFYPMRLTKRWDYIYPAAFAKWKRHDVFSEFAKGKPALAVGYMQPDGIESVCYEICQSRNIDVLPRVTPDVLTYLLNMSRSVVLTPELYGGGQRSILEALACNIPIEESVLNARLQSVLRKGLLTEQDYYLSLKKILEKYE